MLFPTDPILQQALQVILQGLGQFFQQQGQGISQSIGQISGVLSQTDLTLTTANPVVDMGWNLMVMVADSFLGLFGLLGILQILHGRYTGTPGMPIAQFVARLLVTAFLIHASGFLGTELLVFNNQLCSLLTSHLSQALAVINGAPLTGAQNTLLNILLSIAGGLAILRVLFQNFRRIVFLNVLYVLSGPAFLTSFLPQTQAWFAFWLRTYVVTIFTQFFQWLTLTLGIAMFLAAKQTGLAGFLFALATIYLTGEIPGVLARFSASIGANVGGLGDVLRSGMTLGLLFT